MANKLSVKALGCAFGILWGGAVLICAVANIIWPGYAQALLDGISSFYPGYDASPTAGAVVIGTLWALVDGFVGGVILAWIYNLFTKKKRG